MAEASTTLTRITVCADYGGSLAWRVQPEAADLGEDFSRSCGAVLTNGRLDDRHQLALQRTMMPLSTLPQTLDDIVGGVFNLEIDGHGSESPPGRMLSSMPVDA